MTPDRWDDDLDCMVRTCRVCAEEWPITAEFYRAGGRLGRRLTCNACQAEANPRQRRYGPPATRPLTPEQRAKERAKSARYYRRHRDEILERARAAYAARRAA